MARPNSLATGGRSKSTAVADPKSFPSNLVEATTFFAGPVPNEIKSSIELFHSTPVETIENLIAIATKYIMADSSRFNLDQEIYQAFPSPEVANALLTAVYLILRTSLRNKAKISIIKRDLLSMNIPAPMVAKFCESMVASRSPMERVMATQKRIHFPKLEKVRWRIDVAISSGSLTRVMRPNILMQVRVLVIIYAIICRVVVLCLLYCCCVDCYSRRQGFFV